jgi:hypothetical protein
MTILRANQATIDAMNFLRPVIAIVWLAVALLASADQQLTNNPASASTKSSKADLQLLQGTWVGGVPGDKSQGIITITVTGNRFHFHRDTNFWFDTTIQLPAGSNPRQLFATIKDCPPSQASSIGKVVGAIFKIENETLILVTGGSDSSPGGTPKGFDTSEANGQTRFELQKAKARPLIGIKP